MNDDQNDEREVLLSIYDGDSRFKSISPTTYQYKYGEDNDPRSFLLELSWTEKYPLEKPIYNMETFYNKHLASEVKTHIVEELDKESEPLIGEAMTYTLFEWIKEHEVELTSLQPEHVASIADVTEDLNDVSLDGEGTRRADKKVQLTKAQKRRQWNRSDYRGEKPRGWDWVDIVKHLSQTGSKNDQDNATA